MSQLSLSSHIGCINECCIQPVCMALTRHAHVRRYFSEAASLLPTILKNVLHNFYATAALSTSPLIITEYGRYARLFQHSCHAV